MENIDVSNFLNLHSLGNHEFFCLAYVFTYRDFTGGTLGLAWVASASGASGGICERYKTYTETVGGLYQSTKRSLNTGIITFVNYNSRVPPKVSQLTLAHEIGHNFGSPVSASTLTRSPFENIILFSVCVFFDFQHDYPQDCRPGGSSGNYIMFASATSGDRPNNSKFSTCSIRNISNVLDAIEDSKKRNCFTASEGAFCGNKIVEIGEECDCGFNDEECQDKCCYPRLISDSDLSVNSSARGCTRRAYTQCSPSQGPCCLSDKCIFVPANYHQKCKEETECSWSSTCNGTTPECPEPKPRDDKTKCNNGTQLCINGDCSGSICLLWNMSECFLTSQLIQNIDKRKLCELACQNGNDTSTCRSTSEFGLEVGLPEEGISLRPGSPCDNFQGYCDVFLKCRAVDAEGPLVRLKNLLFNEHTFNTLQEWVTDYWYICVLLGIIFIIFMGIFIKCCAVHTPSSNPKKPPARRFSETLRRPMHTLRRMVFFFFFLHFRTIVIMFRDLNIPIYHCSGRETIMADMRRQSEVYRHQRPSVQEVRKVATIVVVVVVVVVAEITTDRIYIHTVPVAVQLHAHLSAPVVAATAATVDDDHRTQVTEQVDHRIAVVPEQCIMGMVVMAEVSNIIHRKMSRTSQFQRRKPFFFCFFLFLLLLQNKQTQKIDHKPHKQIRLILLLLKINDSTFLDHKMLENMPSVHKIPISTNITTFIYLHTFIAKYFLAFICFLLRFFCILSNVIRFAYSDQKWDIAREHDAQQQQQYVMLRNYFLFIIYF